jgi:hypothetical protein
VNRSPSPTGSPIPAKSGQRDFGTGPCFLALRLLGIDFGNVVDLSIVSVSVPRNHQVGRFLPTPVQGGRPLQFRHSRHGVGNLTGWQTVRGTLPSFVIVGAIQGSKGSPFRWLDLEFRAPKEVQQLRGM